MRIGISCYPTIGGSGAVATELGKALARRGCEVHFIVTDVPFRLGEFHRNVFVHALDIISYPVLRTPPADLALAALMARVVREHRLDVLHVHYALPFAACAFLAKQLVPEHPVRVVTTVHGTDVTVLSQDRTLYDVIRLGVERSDALTAVSYSLAEQTSAWFPAHAPLHVIHNFVDPAVFHPQPQPALRQLFAGPEEALCLHVSNFRRVKRVMDVVEVFALIRRARPAKLLLVGEGPDLPDVRARVQALDLERDVVFAGRQDQVAPLYQVSDLFLLPSEHESFGLVALEAMACGVPVVASRTGGIPEVVADGITGFLAPVGDVAAMAAAALQLLNQPSQRSAFAQAACERAHRLFHIDSKVREYLRLYEQLCTRGEPG